jgi:hypothetical protein
MGIPAQVDANKETCSALAARLGIVLSISNTVCKNRKDIKKCYTKCDRFSGQFKEMKSLLAAWLKQARDSNAIITGTVMR